MWPRRVGGSWYELSTGERVQGREAAEEAEAALGTPVASSASEGSPADEVDFSRDTTFSHDAAEQGTVTEMQEVELRPGYKVMAPVVVGLNPDGNARRKMDD